MTSPILSESPERARLAELQRQLLDHIGVAATSYHVDADGDRPVHVLETGSGEPLVLLHGGGAQSTEWAPLLPSLRQRFRCLALDRPGHGLSYPIDYRRVSDMRAHAIEFLTRALDRLGLGRVDIVGNSMGGFFAIALALADPQRVRRLVLIGAPAGMDRPLPTPVRLLSVPVLGPLLWKTVARPTEAGLRRFYAGNLVVDPDKLDPMLIACGAAGHRIPGAAWVPLVRRFATVRGVRDDCYLRDELPALATETLFLWGDRDIFAPPASGRDACERMPDARLEVVPGAGHLPWLDAPETCTAAIVDFLAAPAAADQAI
jgi:pimeloyl-ACP methyl ester carboxylesterase